MFQVWSFSDLHADYRLDFVDWEPKPQRELHDKMAQRKFSKYHEQDMC